MSNKSKYITTAIVYPNNRIHIGWAWEVLGADWLARGYRAMGEETRFLTGMDEHSTKVVKRAVEAGMEPKAFCDQMAGDIEKTLRRMGVSHDRFIRTTDEDHKRVVQSLVQKAFDKGDIYLAKYEGHYCEGCEAFYLDKDLIDGKCVHHGTVPKWIKEENYFFKLSKYESQIRELLSKPGFLEPDHRRAEMLGFMEGGLKDFSISRSTSTFGVQLPFDQKHIVYVWYDALVNYVTGANYEKGDSEFKKWWPADVHIIGKDVNRFHTIYWPAMLMSLDLPLPKKVFVHGWLNLRGERMSKSSGNIISPDDVMDVTGPDPLRYYLLAENQFAGDGNFGWDLMTLKANADLANDWGNLVNRSINMCRKYFPDQELKKPASIKNSVDVLESFKTLQADLKKALDAVDTVAYAQACTARSRVLNLYIDRMKPWGLAKTNTPESMTELGEVIYTLLEGIRFTATALMPILPFGMPEVFRQLGVPTPSELGAIKNLNWGETSYRVGEPKPIYPRIELPKEDGAAAPAK